MKFEDFRQNLRSLSEGGYSDVGIDQQDAYSAGYKAATTSGRTFVRNIPVPEAFSLSRASYINGFLDGLKANQRQMA
jgi:hypothetical protein